MTEHIISSLSLSQAMRKGAALMPQCYGELYSELNGKGIVACCAIGAAIIGVDGIEQRRGGTSYTNSQVRFPALRSKACECPLCVERHSHEVTMYGLISHLNDDHRWPRERIADWLESIGL